MTRWDFGLSIRWSLLLQTFFPQRSTDQSKYSSATGAAPDPDWDYEGRERAGSKQEQLLTTWVSEAVGAHSVLLQLLRAVWLPPVCSCSRSQLGSTPDFRYPVSASSMMDSNSDHYGSALVLRRPQKGRVAALRDEPSKVSTQLICGCPTHLCHISTAHWPSSLQNDPLLLTLTLEDSLCCSTLQPSN